ncbi:rhomboid-like protein [Exophiala viscosa]|uniref:rhomboid-like protein n=1 Tax=Exophiala viscosa TaxID=2486360 RepID=UPI00218EEFBC|nr:rhomboid-like protein [Exophiala viscosa]
MNNAGTVALRLARRCLQASTCQRSPEEARWLFCFNSFSNDSRSSRALQTSSSLVHQILRPAQRRGFSQSTRHTFRQSFVAQRLKPYGSDKKPEKGLRFQKGDLKSKEVISIFGAQAPPPTPANRLLRVLHGRRHDGTLDLPLPDDVQPILEKYPSAFEDGLHWLRNAYPVDEDAAILARIDREEHEFERDNPAELMQRAQDLRLYMGPQSGHYQAKLSDKEDDVFGVSELDKIRAENEERYQREEEELQAQIDERMTKVKEDRTKSLAQRPEQGLESANEVRPPNSVEKWILKAQNRAQTKMTLESPEVAEKTMIQRLLPSLIFVSLVVGASYLYSQYWVRPKQSERFFPTVSLSFATITGVIATNFVIFCAWRMPPFWRLLNKYFIIVPAYPYAFSMLGSIFSHQTLTHFLANMIPLLIFGLPLHEDVGRGTFLAIYLSSGLVGSFASLARHALSRVFITTTLGASGSIYGIVAAYLWLHLHDRFSIMFLPPDVADQFSFSGQSLLIALGLLQVFGSMRRTVKIDYFDHLIGMIVGIVAAWWWQSNKEKNGESRKKSTNWWSTLPGVRPGGRDG